MSPPALPEVLTSRVDALVLGFRGELRAGARQEFLTRMRDQRLARTAVPVNVGGVPYAMSSTSRDGRWLLENGTHRVLIDEGRHLAGWGLEVTARAVALATHGLRPNIVHARDVAHVLLSSAIEERARRFDLAADFVRFDVRAIDPDALVHPRRSGLVEHGRTANGSVPIARHLRSERCTGFSVGRNDVRVRIYDKTRELLEHRDDEKRRVEEQLWSKVFGADGRPLWTAGAPVTRVEAQLRGGVLKELLDGRLRDPDELLDPSNLDAVWSYITKSWLRLVDLSTRSRRRRCETDPRWGVVQALRFAPDGVRIAVPTRSRRRSLAGARFALGVLTNHAALIGALPIGGVFASNRSIPEVVEQLEEAAAEDLVRDILTELFREVGQGVCETLLTEMGPAAAAAFLIERVAYAAARRTEIEDVARRAERRTAA